jgi:hypothetical protein
MLVRSNSFSFNWTRDKNLNIQTEVFSVLSKNVSYKKENHLLMGPTHLQNLNVTQREPGIQIGLKDHIKKSMLVWVKLNSFLQIPIHVNSILRST